MCLIEPAESERPRISTGTVRPPIPVKLTMPFPLAHPAAVLPLRRWCPRRLSLAALVIGSLTPDLGYLFEGSHAAAWSHSFWTGGPGFCLPAGWILFWMLRGLQRLMFGMLPSKSGQMLQPMFDQPTPPWFVLLISLLIGAWTHILLDSFTHADGWFVQHLAMLRCTVALFGGPEVKVCRLLYYGITFFGVAYVAYCFQQWLEKAHNSVARLTPASKWMFALLFSGFLLIVYASGRYPR